jgi:hypothetical protein
MNSEYENLKYKRILVLSFRLNPRFPTIDGSGVVEQRIRVWHNYHWPVKLRRVLAIGRTEKEGAEDAHEIDPADLFGTSVVTQSGVEASIRFDTRKDKKITMIDYIVSGETEDGVASELRFSIMKPPDLPTREDSVRVTDPLLHAKIVKAREILHQEFVTDDDLFRLENAGKFEGLQPVENHVASLAPPKNLPKAPILPPAPEGAEGQGESAKVR